MIHQPVLLQAVIEQLAPSPGGTAIDATVGLGGHAKAIGQCLGSSGRLLGLDQDSEALKLAKQALASNPAQIVLRQANFDHLKSTAAKAGFDQVEVILFDLGVSSWQLDRSGRGFSFNRDEPLLMSMTTTPGPITAKEIVNHWPANRLKEIFSRLGQEPASRALAEAIVARRQAVPFTTTGQLAELIESVKPRRPGQKLHPATLVFQALRMTVNEELSALTSGLKQAWSLLAPGGRLGVISFHSLEARLVKQFFKHLVQTDQGQMLTKKAIKPTTEEILANSRARSATFRVIKKIN